MPLSAGLTSKRALTCRQHLLALLVVVGTLYGSSYQQFRHFDPADPRGLSDAKSYLLMAEGNYDASMTHRFRVMIPALVGWLSTSTNRQDQESLVLLFYIVNFSLMTATGFFLYLILGKVGFKGITSLLGVCMFTCSRTAVYSTAVPLVDSLYYFSIATIVLLCFVERRYSLFIVSCLDLLQRDNHALSVAAAIVEGRVSAKIPCTTPPFASGFLLVVLHVSFILFWLDGQWAGRTNTQCSCDGTLVWSRGQSSALLESPGDPQRPTFVFGIPGSCDHWLLVDAKETYTVSNSKLPLGLVANR